jgi:Family of unknown function (DUF6165)
MRVYVPVSAGDLIDRITILRIKMEQIPDAATVARIGDELEHLTAIRNCFAKLNSSAVAEKETSLQAANKALWDAENRVRALDAKNDFGGEFVTSARSIYRGNGERAKLKREINDLAGSALREEKWFSDN